MSSLYAEQYEYGYWDGYAEAKRLTSGDRESPTDGVVEPTHDGSKGAHAEPSYIREVRDLQELVGEGMSKPTTDGVASREPDIILMQDSLVETAVPPLENSI